MRSDRGRLLLAAGLAASLLLSLGPIGDPDLPWHLSAGRRIVAERAIPRSDFLSWTEAGKPWTDFEWGSELLFYGLEKAGGETALWAFKSGAYFALALEFSALLALWSLPLEWIALAAPAFSLAFYPLAEIRPEIFSFLFFLLEFILLELRRLRRLRLGENATLLLHAGLYALWANLHAGFAVGLALCAVYGLAELAAPRAGEPRRRSPLYWAGAAMIGTMLNPRGPGLYEVFWIHWGQQAELRRLITEWSRPNFIRFHLDGYWLLLVFSFAGLLAATAQGVPVPMEHLAAAVFFALVSSRAVRTVAYSLLSVFPLGLWAWSRAPSPRWWRRWRGPALGAALGLFLWRGLIVVRILGTPEPPPSLEAQGPQRALTFLRSEKAVLGGLRLFNPYNIGGYFGYFLNPDYKVYMDGRYLFAGLLDQTDAAEGDPGRWRGLMDEKGIQLAVLDNQALMLRPFGVSEGRPYLVYAMPPVEWALIYWDSQVVILVRRDAVPAAWLTQREFRFLRPHDTHYMTVQMLTGQVAPQEVAEEIERYRREIGDPAQVLEFESWFMEFERRLSQKSG